MNGVRTVFERPETEQHANDVELGCGVDLGTEPVCSKWWTVPHEYAPKGTPTEAEAIFQVTRTEEWGGHYFTRLGHSDPA